MKKIILGLFLSLAMTTVAISQTSDTVKTPNNGTVIINIDHLPKKQPRVKKPNVPQQPASEKQLQFDITVQPAVNETFLSNEGIVFAILFGMAFVAILFLLGGRRWYGPYGYYNENGIWVRHHGNVTMTGNMEHNGQMAHTGTVEHIHRQEPPVAIAPVENAGGGDKK